MNHRILNIFQFILFQLIQTLLHFGFVVGLLFLGLYLIYRDRKKVKITKIPIPLAYSPAFHGERVRKENTYVQFGGKYSHSFEFLTDAYIPRKLETGDWI